MEKIGVEVEKVELTKEANQKIRKEDSIKCSHPEDQLIRSEDIVFCKKCEKYLL